MHANAALVEGGFSTGDVKEIVLQQAIYCGVPAANKAFDVLREIAEAKSPQRSGRKQRKPSWLSPLAPMRSVVNSP